MIKVEKLPTDLKNFGTQNFERLFSLRPNKQGEVLVYNKNSKIYEEKRIFRHYMSYLDSPPFDPQTNKSYMFSNFKDDFRSSKAPDLFEPFVNFAKLIDPRYNQMTVNWYDKEHYIEMHRDCTAKFVDETSPVLMINLNETDYILKCRSFVLEDVLSKEKQTYRLDNGICLTMEGDCQKTHRHGVGPGFEKRISVTFRMIRNETDLR